MSRTTTIIIMAVSVLVVAGVALMLGVKEVPFSAVLDFQATTDEGKVFWKLRVPRVCIAFLAGGALSISGLAFQAMFRNSLATPFTLGTSSGASLGAAVAVRLGLTGTILGTTATTMAAFIGAVISILLVYGLTRGRHAFSTATMLLAGVAVSFFFSSLILFVQYTSDFYNSFRILRWLMGGLGHVNIESIIGILPLILSGAGLLFYLVDELNLLTTGDDIAASRGVAVQRTRQLIFLATSLMVGGIVAICGPIGFVGLMVPHICRLLIGSDHRYLLPACLLFGGGFLIFCDTVARLIFAPAEMPVGVLTAFLGGPFFLWLLVGTKARIGSLT